MSGRMSARPDKGRMIFCSFCRERGDRTPAIVTSDSANICFECILVCVDIIAGEENKAALRDPAWDSEFGPLIRAEAA